MSGAARDPLVARALAEVEVTEFLPKAASVVGAGAALVDAAPRRRRPRRFVR